MYLFSQDKFLVHCAPERIHPNAPKAAACTSVLFSLGSILSRPCSLMSSSSPSAPCKHCCGGTINKQTKDNPCSLPLGGFVTEQDFIDRAKAHAATKVAKRAYKELPGANVEPLKRG